MDDSLDLSARIRFVTWVGIWVNLVLAVVKVVAGILGRSQALVADGLESGMDILTSFGLLIGARYWTAPPDEDHPYGHRRIETLVTLGIGLVVAGVGVTIALGSLHSLRTGEHQHPNLLALAVAFLSVVGKELLYQWSAREGRAMRSSAVVANAVHHRSDAISSVPVLLSVGAAQLLPGWGFLDAVGALFAAGFILKTAAEISWPALREMADTGAEAKILAHIREIAVTTEGVRSLHELRTRYVGSSLHVDLHLVVGPDITVLEGHRIGDAATARIKAELPDVLEVLVHLDPSEDM
jgi:cation diffusion facilitator family transporter